MHLREDLVSLYFGHSLLRYNEQYLTLIQGLIRMAIGMTIWSS